MVDASSMTRRDSSHCARDNQPRKVKIGSIQAGINRREKENCAHQVGGDDKKGLAHRTDDRMARDGLTRHVDFFIWSALTGPGLWRQAHPRAGFARLGTS